MVQISQNLDFGKKKLKTLIEVKFFLISRFRPKFVKNCQLGQNFRKSQFWWKFSNHLDFGKIFEKKRISVKIFEK